MSALRAAVRLLLAAPVTLFAWLVALGGSLLLAPWPRRRSRLRGWAYRFWSRALCRIFGVRTRTVGTPPRPPFVLVSNHVSYLDILVLGTAVPCVFVAKAEIDQWPLFGAISRSVETIFVDRKAKRRLPEVIARIEATLAAHQGVVIFPEGTSGAGDRLMPFRSPLLELPVRMAHPVHWAALHYRAPAGAPPTHLAVTWWGEMPLVPHLWQLLRLSHVEATLTFGVEPLLGADRKQLADALWNSVSAAFVPMAERIEIERLEGLRLSDPDQVPPILRPHRPGGPPPQGTSRLQAEVSPDSKPSTNGEQES